MSNLKTDLAVVAELLATGKPSPLTRRLRLLGRALPRVAEHWAALRAPEAEMLAKTLTEKLWPLAQQRVGWEIETGWPTLQAGCLTAAEILEVELPKTRSPEHEARLREEMEAIRPPAVYALLRGGPPSRILMAKETEDIDSHAWTEDAESLHCRDLARTLLGYAGKPIWRLVDQAPGNSKMAGLLLRLIAESGLPASLRGESIGITGALDNAGNLLPVAGITDKVQRFFDKFYDGICFVPKGNWDDLQVLRPRPFGEQVRQKAEGTLFTNELSELSWQRICPVRSITELLIRLGMALGHLPATHLFAVIRERSQYVTDWRGTKLRADAIVPLPLRDVKHRRDPKKIWTYLRESLKPEDIVTRISHPVVGLNDGTLHGAVVSGLPGSGKSMVLQRLFFELNAGCLRLVGPAILINARRVKASDSWGDALSRQLRSRDWQGSLVGSILTAKELRGGVWLLLDGLDELPLERRRMVLAMLQDWPGPFVVATRRLRQAEQLAGTLQTVIKDLDLSTQEALLNLDQRSDIFVAIQEATRSKARSYEERPRTPGNWREREVDPLPPSQQLLLELAATPLGLSLLAATTLPSEPLPEARAQLLRQGIDHLIDRAESKRRISEAERLLFDSYGVRLIGAAAWSMLRVGRAVMSAEDMQWARSQLKLTPTEYLCIARVLSAAGFVERIGAAQHEFSHKSFAEYCAGMFLAERPALQEELLARIGDPGIDEVLLHLCTLSENVTSWLQRLNTNTQRPLSALSLAIRVLAECQTDAVDADAAAPLLMNRLRLLSWFPGQELPADLGRPGALWTILRRFTAWLRPYTRQLVDVCHPNVKLWLENPPVFECKRGDYSLKSDYYREPDWRQGDQEWKLRREIAEQIFVSLRPQIPIAALLRFRNSRDLLGARTPGDWFVELEPFLQSKEPYLLEMAQDIWLKAAPLARRIELLSALRDYQHGWNPQRADAHRDEILDAVLKEGTPLQQREAVLRAGLAAIQLGRSSDESNELMNMDYWELAGERPSMAPVGAERWLQLWDWAWYSGLAGKEGGAKLEELYERFLRDANEIARWRAIVAMRTLCNGRITNDSGFRGASAPEHSAKNEAAKNSRRRRLAEARTLMSDPSRIVRAEALQFLVSQEEALSIEELLPFCLSMDTQERWLGWAAVLKRLTRLPLVPLLHILADEKWETRRRLPYEERSSVTRTRAEHGFDSHGETARTTLITWARKQCRQAEHRRELYTLLNDLHLGGVTKELLTEGYSEELFPITELIQILSGCVPAARQWAAAILAASHRSPERQQLLLSLCSDADPVVAAHGRTLVAEQEREEEWRQRRPQQVGRTQHLLPVVELDHSSVAGYPDFARLNSGLKPEMREPFVISRLDCYASFESLWTDLREHPLPVESFNTVHWEGRDDRLDHIEHAAELASIENVERFRPVVTKLHGLFESKYRVLCMRDLGHPLVGLFAEILLSSQPPDKDLLPLIARDEKSAVRVARIARRTTLAAAAIDAFINAAHHAKLAVPHQDADHDSTLDLLSHSHPPWLAEFERLAGVEGIVRLLGAGLPRQTEVVVLKYLDQQLRSAGENISQAVRSNVLAWARSVAQVGQVELAQLVALHILARLGDAQDAERWVEILSRHIAELPEQVVADALKVVERHGSSRHVPLLRQLLVHCSVSIAVSSLAALSAIGSVREVELFFERLDGSWLLKHRPPKRRIDDMHVASVAGEAALLGIIRHGDRQHALELAKRLAADANIRADHDISGELQTCVDADGTTLTRSIRRHSTSLFAETAPGEHRYYELRPLDHAALTAANQYGRHSEHALLILGALLHDPGDQSYGINVAGYDEEVVEESKVPAEASATIRAVVERTDKEEVRRAFLTAMLWGGATAPIARAELDRLGGVQERDVPLLLSHLEQQPASEEALSLLAEFTSAEVEIVATWAKCRCPWWLAS